MSESPSSASSASPASFTTSRTPVGSAGSTGPTEPTEPTELGRTAPPAEPSPAGGALNRVMVLERDRGDTPVPRHRKAAPTATAVMRAKAALRAHGVQAVDPAFGGDVDLVLVLGGDGTILRASEIARQRDVPLVGVNTGHVGFLAEADPDAVEGVVADLVDGRYTVETRMTIDVEVTAPDGAVTHDWALNEAALEKRDRARMLEVAIGVDGQAVSSFGCDGLVMATPTGSTAYAYSGGGPVIWPEVEALLLVPLVAHALFTRPLVLGPNSCLEVVIQHAGLGDAEVWCDGRRSLDAPAGSRIRVRRADRPVRLARLNDAPFATRLVRKFDLPVEGWRNPIGDSGDSDDSGDPGDTA